MWASIAGAATGLAGSIWGGIQASKNAEKAENILSQQRQKNDDWYGRRYHQDYVQTAEAQNLLNSAREAASEAIQSSVGRSRVGGGSAEETAAAIEKAGSMLSNTASNIAAQATQEKNRIDNLYQQKDAAIDSQYYNLYNSRAQASTSAANEAMKAGMGLINSDMQANLKYGKGLFEAMFKKEKKEE